MNPKFLFFLTWISNLAVCLVLDLFIDVPTTFIVLQPPLAAVLAVSFTKKWRSHEKARQP